jgi:hypothetical protein
MNLVFGLAFQQTIGCTLRKGWYLDDISKLLYLFFPDFIINVLGSIFIFLEFCDI